MNQEKRSIKTPVRSALGRGLSALISTPPVSISRPTSSAAIAHAPQNIESNQDVISTSPNGVKFVAIEHLFRNEHQPRQDFSPNEIKELSDSIRTLGILQPILVRPRARAGEPHQTYEIVAGERRYRAAKEAQLATVPVIVKELDDRSTLEIALVENLQRENLNPIETALALQRLIDDFGLTQQQAADRVGKDRTSVANLLRLLKLHPEIIQMIRAGDISLGHSKIILSIRDSAAQLSAAKRTISEGLSVRALEALVAQMVVLDSGRRAKPANSSSQSEKDAYPEIIDRLRNSLGTKVRIKPRTEGSGKIEIEYYSEQELDRLVEQLSSPAIK